MSDSRSNAGMDNINTHRKMYVFEVPGERVVCLMTSGNLSLTHTVIALIEEDMLTAKMSPDHPHLMNQPTMFETARYVGAKIREVEATERPHLEKDDYRFNINCIVGGQIASLPHQIYRIYPQGNVVHASDDSPFLQIGEFKYGKPILDRGFTHKTSLYEAVKFGALSMDSTMKSNVSVGPPVDIMCYTKDSLRACHRVRLSEGDPYLQEIRGRWSRGLTELVHSMPELKFPDEPQDVNVGLTSG